jgi:hypothetical protein
MPTLHVATSRRASRKVPVPATPAVGNAEGDIASKTQVLSAIVQTVDPDARQMMIAEAAYYLAEQRGFTPGGELQDWLDAEAQIETSLRA